MMISAEQKKIFRALDANLNRSREGLRVIEDYFRFVSEENSMRNSIRRIRHSLKAISSDKKLIKSFIENRDSKNDQGKHLDSLEAKRKDVFDVVYANFQRVKESLRVMEELLKIADKSKVETAKKIRYRVYAVEKQTFKEWAYLRNSGQRNNR